MATDKNIRILGIALAGLMLMGIASVLSSSSQWFVAALMIAGIAFIGLSGALFIKATWVKNDAKREKKQWGLLDSRLIS